MPDIKIINRETLSQRKFQLEYITYLKPDAEGNMGEHQAEIYYRPDAAAVLLYDSGRKKFLLASQFRLASYLNGNETGYLTEACAGLIDEGETPEQTAIREVKEELGYSISNINKVGSVYTSAGGITEFVHLFTAAYNAESEHTGGGGGLPEEGEEIDAIEMDFDEAYNMLKEGKINDAKSVMLLQHYFLFR
jgi:GDP-mannose pyrophosphatase NudK